MAEDPVVEREQFKNELLVIVALLPAYDFLTLTHACGHTQKFDPAELTRKIKDDTGEGKRWLDWYVQVAKSRQP